jgi:ribonuclease III
MKPEPLFAPAALEQLQERLGVRFRQLELLTRALTHESYTNEVPEVVSNERLEFLGDAVLGLFVAELLAAHHPTAREGSLTRMKAALVSAEGLARLAVSLDLGGLLLVGKGARGEGVKGRSSVLSDALEAVLGAVYLDQGPLAARACVERLFGAQVGDVDAQAADPKSQLQLETQRHSKELPVYRLIESRGPAHAPTFHVEVSFQGQALGRGSGATKKAAQQAAASQALQALARREPAEQALHAPLRAVYEAKDPRA